MNVNAFLDPATCLTPNAGPRYVQLRQRMSDGVAQGILKRGAPLPPEASVAPVA
jgi:GntR family transcriptional regulator